MASPRFVVLEKPIGQTPLETMNSWRALHPEFAELPATYAGRLDPMASGKLLVLLGEECSNRDRYVGLDKEYEVEVVLDLSTDTGDALGLPALSWVFTNPSTRKIQNTLRTLTGTHVVPYPAFSSKTVQGKALFQYALEGALDTVSIPEHKETIYRADFVKKQELTAARLEERLEEILRVVPRNDESSKLLGADFRQDEIRTAWDSLLNTLDDRKFTVISLRITCASGTYMRTLAARLGEALGTKGFALSIHRSRIGKYAQLGPFGFWVKSC